MSGQDFIGPVFAFVVILALIPAALWLLKRSPLGGAASGIAPMRVVGALPLAPNQRLVTVEVGQGEQRRWLVLGVSPGGISTLHDMAPQAEPPTPAASGPAFAQMLRRQQPGDGDAR